jgi:tRNA (guanine-N7-)-methyltransferase
VEPGAGAFFGRRRGKTLRAGQRAALEAGLPALLIDIAEPPPAKLASLFARPVDHVRIEIGFGGGEHLIAQAVAEPNVGTIGIEPFRNGMAKAVAAIVAGGLRNVRLFDQDAILLLDWLPPGQVAGIDLLFPDPWPKTRHRKRRFVTAANLDRIVRVLAAGGVFRFATDVEAYVSWTLKHVASHGGLVWTEADRAACRRPWSGWPGTRYEAKAAAAGRRPTYLIFRKLDANAGMSARF